MNYENIAKRYKVSVADAAKIRTYIDTNEHIDWSEASYAEIDKLVKRASKALGIKV